MLFYQLTVARMDSSPIEPAAAEAKVMLRVDSDVETDTSTAVQYLAKHGWTTGLPWGFEVRLPAKFRLTAADSSSPAPFSSFAARGVTRADGSPLPQSGEARLLILAGLNGPMFLVTSNFDVGLVRRQQQRPFRHRAGWCRTARTPPPHEATRRQPQHTGRVRGPGHRVDGTRNASR